jgi:hypothetical protein
MPWTVSHPAAPGGKAPGQHGGWLGKGFDPFRVEGNPDAPGFEVAGLGLPEGLDAPRMSDRRALLAALGHAHAPDLAGTGPRAWDGFQARALDALVSAEARGAFQIDREDPRIRDRYGRHIHGQCLLMARRLVEAGVGLVTVNWHDDGRRFWDTHGSNFARLKDELMPPADRGFAALLDDLSARGLLEETLVVWVGEFGRIPRISKANAGRDRLGRLRPLGRLSDARPGQSRRPRRLDPPCSGDRPGHRDPRPARSAAADQYRHPPRRTLFLIARRLPASASMSDPVPGRPGSSAPVSSVGRGDPHRVATP